VPLLLATSTLRFKKVTTVLVTGIIYTVFILQLIIPNQRQSMKEKTFDVITLCVQVKSQNGFARTLNGSDALSNLPIFIRLCRGSIISLLMQISRVLKSVLPTSWPYRQANCQYYMYIATKICFFPALDISLYSILTSFRNQDENDN